MGNRPGAVHRPGPFSRARGRLGGARALRDDRRRARPDRRGARSRPAGTGRRRAGDVRNRRGARSCGRADAGAKVSRRQRRLAGLLDGLHAGAYHAAAPRDHGRPGDAVRSPRLACLRRRCLVHERRRSGAELARAARLVGLRDLGRRRCHSYGSCSSRSSIGASRDFAPTSSSSTTTRRSTWTRPSRR